MIKFKLHIDTINYDSKPENYAEIKPRLQNENTIQEVTLLELISKIEQGYTISPAVMRGMSANDWQEQTIFMVDIDNNETNIPILTVEEALEICNKNFLLPAFYYPTFSSTEEKPKYRLVFIMNKTITDNNLRLKVISSLVELFPQSDKSCRNADRIFLGTNKKVVKLNLYNRININFAFAAATSNVLDNNKSNNNELEILKANFNLFRYMCKDNIPDKSYPGYITFKTCIICGHRNCLVYYFKSNTFYCFGANGNKGGSVIDYFMYTENLSLKEAIQKLKGESTFNKKKINKLVCCSAKDLQNKDLPPIEYYVKGLIPQGENLLCSAPKIGKSWLALDMCLSISRGLPILGFETKKSSCLYLALEDSENRLKDRINKLLNGTTVPDNFYYSINSNNLAQGLINELEDCLKEHPDIKVIVIDTLQKIRGASKSNNAYANDYEDLSMIKSFADTNSLCIIIVHHLRKAKDSTDVFESVSGTNGITGTADTTLILSKDKRSDINTTLSVVGRDVDFNEFIIKFNKDTCKWEMICDSQTQIEEYKRNLYNNNKIVILIKEILKDTDTWSGTMNELNNLYKEKFGKLYIEKKGVSALGNAIKNLAPQLLKYDNITYTPPPKNPRNGAKNAELKKE